MRKFIDLAEVYSKENTWLLQYLRNGEMDPYPCWWEICHWLEENDYLEEVSEALGQEFTSADDLNEEEPDLFFKFPENLQKRAYEDAIETMMRHNAAEAPTTAHLSPNADRLLPRDTWLIHFSDDAASIAREGFRYGMDRMDQLGLTTWFKKGAKTGGYNFAYHATSRDASYAASQGKYGRHAVMFQNSGVDCTHYGDEEDQVIFWGADVKPANIILIFKSSETGEWEAGEDARGEPVISGEFDDVVSWIMQNHAQYRRQLYT